MEQVKLIRLCSNYMGTFGCLIYAKEIFMQTLEPIQPIIPNGKYICSRIYSWHEKGERYEVKNVPGHDLVELHRGNTINDTQGCILVGLDHVTSGLQNSTIAFNRLMSIFKDDFEMEVVTA